MKQIMNWLRLILLVALFLVGAFVKQDWLVCMITGIGVIASIVLIIIEKMEESK